MTKPHDKTLSADDIELRHRISTEQDLRIFKATKELMELAAKLGIETVEVGGIKIVNSCRQGADFPGLKEKVLQGQSQITNGHDPLDFDPYTDPLLNPPENQPLVAAPEREIVG